MIGAAHTSTIRDLEAARRDMRAADSPGDPWVPETPLLPLLTLSAADTGPLDWSRAAAGLED